MWYTNPDWWSAIGQWVGGIGTLVAVLITMRQIKETRQLQLDLIKPELILETNVASYMIGAGTSNDDFRFLEIEFTITATNIKSTPVCIKDVTLSRVRFFSKNSIFKKIRKKNIEYKYSIAARDLYKKPNVFKRVISKIKDFKSGGSIFFIQENIIQETPFVIKSGEFRSDTIKLDTYKRRLEVELVVFLRFNYSYTTKQDKSMYVLLIHPAYRDSSGLVIDTGEDYNLMKKEYQKVLRRVRKSITKNSNNKSA